jgi:cysteine desulfurase
VRTVKKARQQMAELIGAEPGELIYTSCGTESDNTAINAALKTQPGKKHIVTTGWSTPAS